MLFVLDSGVGSARFGLSVPEVALLLEGLDGAVDTGKYIFGLLRRKKKSKKTLEREAAAKLAAKAATAAAATAMAASSRKLEASAAVAAEDDSPSRKRAKLAATGEFASPEPEQPAESMMSPDGPGGDMPSPQAASPIVVDLSSVAQASKKAVTDVAAAASGPTVSGLTDSDPTGASVSATAAASSSSRKRKVEPHTAASGSSKKQKGIMSFFVNK